MERDLRFRPHEDFTGERQGELRALLDAASRPVYLAGANLRGVDLSGVDLGGVVLSGADLRGANLRGVTVRGGTSGWPRLNLSAADLTGVDLAGAELASVSFRSAVLEGVIWDDATVVMVGELPQRDACDFHGAKHDFPTIGQYLETAGVDRDTGAVLLWSFNPRIVDRNGDVCSPQDMDGLVDQFFWPPWRQLDHGGEERAHKSELHEEVENMGSSKEEPELMHAIVLDEDGSSATGNRSRLSRDRKRLRDGGAQGMPPEPSEGDRAPADQAD